MDELGKRALEYRTKYKFNVIPLKPNTKKPAILWTLYQDNLATVDEVKKWWGEQFPGANIGLVCGEVSNIIGLDFDTYKDKTPWVQFLYMLEQRYNIKGVVTPETINTAVSHTPRGGYHVLYSITKELYNNTLSNAPSRGITDSIGIELKSNKKLITLPPSIVKEGQYKWVNDLSMLSSIDNNIIDFIYNILRGSNKPLQTVTNHNISFELGNRDETLFHLAWGLVKGGVDEDNIRRTLEFLAQHCNPPFQNVQEKVDSAIKRVGMRPIAQEVRDWVNHNTSVTFNLTNCYGDLGFITKDNKAACRQVIHRMVQEGSVEKVGSRWGYYRKTDQNLIRLEIPDELPPALDIQFPFQIEKLIEIYPRTIYVIAGSQGAGKSAFSLNFALINQDKHKIVYFSSEFSEYDLHKRLIGGLGLAKQDIKFPFYDKHEDFRDVISPDSINIIDWLEIPDNFYLIGQKITDIWGKLDKGIALINIQKDPKSSVGRGGSFSLERPCFYASVDIDAYDSCHYFKIIKARNLIDSSNNPVGLQKKFKIRNGVEILCSEDWARERRPAF